MSALFQNLTVRSAGDLLADLAACRQLRHLTDADREMVVQEAFYPHDVPYRAPQNPQPGVICPQCGRPRSGLPSKTGRYAPCGSCSKNSRPKGFVWLTDAFQIAMKNYGYSCDTCPAVIEVSVENARRGGDRALENLDGKLKLMTCQKCASKFAGFARREFGRDVRTPYDRDLEKIMTAFLAWMVHLHAERVKRAA